jgi:NADP-dependent 3-hydroxy acid dehydrogenase YdfG
MNTTSFHSKAVIITGASSGIGWALALQLADQGACIALAARHAERLETLAADCTRRGGKAIAVPIDVTDEKQC